MSVYSMVSSILSYVFTTIIYLFILAVIGLIYMDIKKMGEKDKKPLPAKKETEECYAVLRTVKNSAALELKMKAGYRMNSSGISVGRGKRCDLALNHAFLSAEHFRVWCENGKWFIKDEDSKNGTFLNGKRLKKIRHIEDGDEISFGELQFVFKEEN